MLVLLACSINFTSMKSIYFFTMILTAALFFQCKDDNIGNPDTDCGVVASSLQVDGNKWMPCGGSFEDDTLADGTRALTFLMNDAVSSTGRYFVLVGGLYFYAGTGTYMPNQSNVLLRWQEWENLQPKKDYSAKNGTFEVVQQDDTRMKVKIDCIFSDSTTNVAVKGEFEIQDE